VCQVWFAQNAKGSAELCVTSDGLPLRVRAVGRDGSQSSVVASSVQPGPNNPALFQVPADHPSLGGGFSPFSGFKG
jgi:hypothetical protein